LFFPRVFFPRVFFHGAENARKFARRLRRAKRGGEFVARLDGAEFALMMTDILLAPQALARGRAVADALMQFGIGYLGVEADENRLREALADGYAVMFGRMDDPRLWQPMAIEGRKLNVLSDPDFETAAEIMPAIREQYPELRLLAAALDAVDAKHFAEIGVEAVDDSFGDSTPLAKEVLMELGIEPAAIEDWIARRRQSITEDVREAA